MFINPCLVIMICTIIQDLKLARVSDVLQLNPLPKAICSLQAWKGDDDRSSTVENELFILKQVRQSTVVFSLMTIS